MFKRFLIMSLLGALGSCVGAPSPPPVPLRQPPVVLRPAPPPPVTALPERPFTGGDWRYAQGVARFGAPSLFEARCDASRRVVLLTVSGATATSVTLRASTTARALPATATPAGSVVQVAATDAILDALAFSRGSFAVQAGATVLTLPAWPEFARVVEDCRG